MSLTLHCDASDTGKLFTTYNVSGVHTGTPSDGSVVQVWDDEGDGIADVILRAAATEEPLWRSTTPLLIAPCLDFDGVNDGYQAFNQIGTVFKPLSNFITASAFTVIMAFYAESITNTSSTFYNTHCLIADTSQYWGIFLHNVSGQRKVTLYNYDGTEDYLALNISENTRYVLMCRHDAGNLYMSLNGGAESSPVASGNTAALTGNFVVGGATDLLNGRMGEFKVWNTGNADGAGNVATQIAAMMSKWVTPSGTSTPVSLSASLALAGQIAKRLNKPFAGVI